MIAVRTSKFVGLYAEGINEPSCEGGWNRPNNVLLVHDRYAMVMRRARGHDVLPLEFKADEVFGAVELDLAANVKPADERYPPICDGKRLAAAGIQIILEREARGGIAEDWPETLAKGSREPSAVLGEGEVSAVLLGVIAAKEAVACPAQSMQIGGEAKKTCIFWRPLKFSTETTRPSSPGKIETRRILNRR